MMKQALLMAQDVRIAIDQNMTSNALLADGDMETLELDKIIISKLEDACRWSQMNAPMEKLDPGVNFAEPSFWTERGESESDTMGVNEDLSGWCYLPADFLRLVVFRMSDWERPVYHAVRYDSAEYYKQGSRQRGLRGTPQKPVCAIVPRAEGLSLEFYSCKDQSATVAQASYVRVPKIEEFEEQMCIEVSEKCYRATVMMAGALTLMTLGDTQQAALLEAKAEKMLRE